MRSIFQDIRYALRQLRKDVTFTAIAVITLALAISANTAIFSVVHTVLLTPLPYPDADRLMMIWGQNLSRGDHKFPLSAGVFADWKQKNDVFEDLGASFDNAVTLTGAGEPKLVLGYNFTANFFSILGVAPAMGRTFSQEEARSGAKVAVISDKFWRSTLHGDRQVLGKAITLDAKPFTIIGIMPPDFNWPPRTELWMPMYISSTVASDYERRYLRVMGRLKPGISIEQAQIRMNALARQIAGQHPQTDSRNETWVEPLRYQISGDVRTPLLMLFGAVGIVLLMAAVNIAGLMLARAATRHTEISVRLAIGASRARLLQQYLSEGLVLALIGGALGVVLALWCTRFLVSIFPNNIANLSIPRVEAIPVNAPVLGFALGITLLTALAFAAVPAMQSANANEALKESSRTVTSGGQSARARRIMVTAEISLSLILLAGAGLIVESFRRVYREDLGFRPDHVLGLEVFLAPNRYPDNQPEQRSAFVRNVLDGLRRLPDARSVAATNFLPLTGFWGTTDFTIEGQPPRGAGEKPQGDNRLITPGYFSTMGIPLLQGRDFSESDGSDSEHVAIINSTLARHYFGSQDPLNKVVVLADAAHSERWRIVGLVSDVKAFRPEEPAHADLYRPLAQASFPLLAFTVRTQGDPAALLKPAKQAIWEVDKDQPVFDAMPLGVLAAQSVSLRRVSAILVASFAGLALVLAAVGLYGLMAYSVAQRTHEIGIRMALGAQHDDVLRLVVRNAMYLVVVGEVVGLAAAIVLSRAIAGLLYGVSPGDPRNLAAAIALLTLVAVAASYIPARRAAKVDPMVALRYE
jgi:predicted permease